MTAARIDLPPLPELPKWATKWGVVIGNEVMAYATNYATAAVLADRAARLDAKPVATPFIVKHYSADERPNIKGNGFDGLEVGKDRAEAEDFVSWVNAHIAAPPADARDRVIAQHVLALRQLLDIWDAGMPEETARPDMVEAFNAVRAAMLETPTKEAT